MTDVICGGWTDPMPATADIQKMCDRVRGIVEATTKESYEEFVAVEYRNQLVAGLKYAIKVHVGGPDYLHLDLFQQLPCNGGKVELYKAEHRRKEDPL